VCYDLNKEELQDLIDLHIEPLAFIVELKNICDDSFSVEFTKISGDKYEFFDVYDEYIKFVQTD